MGVSKHKYRLLFATALVAVVVVSIVSMSGRKADPSADILSQKIPAEGKTQITVLVKYAFAINGFEKAVEEKFPDIDIVQVGNYTRNMGMAEYTARLKHGDIPDIVMTWPLEVGEEYWADRLLDLSGFDFTAKYNLSMLNDVSRNGKLYYLPGPSQVRGIVYNKTLFEENHWQVPKDYEGFVALCRTIENTGIRALQLGLKNPEVLDTGFFGYSLAACLSKPQDSQWLIEYNHGSHSFGDHFSSALDHFQLLIDDGILKKSDLEINYADREQMLFKRKCAMVEDSVLITRMGYGLTGTTDEFALMPFFNPNGGEDWARLYMVCYIGLNKDLAQPENKEKFSLVMELMDYISTPEGQASLMSDTSAMFSSVSGVDAPAVPEIVELLPALQEGRYAVLPQLRNAQAALREGLAGMVRGEMTAKDVIRMVDEQNAVPVLQEEDEVIGQAEMDFSLIETGNFVTDVMRQKSGADFALFLDNGKDGFYNGMGISARLYQGDLTAGDIDRIMPDLKMGEKGTMWKIEMTGENLIKTLEYSIPVGNNQRGWFYYFSGLHMEYDPSAEMGSRIHKITGENGKGIDPDKTYTVAVMDHSVPDEYIQSTDETGISIRDMLIDSIKQSGEISPSLDGRFCVAGP